MTEKSILTVTEIGDSHGPNTPAAVYVVESEEGSYLYRIFITEEIAEPKYYRMATNALMEAGMDDEVEIILNTSGGNLDTTLQMVSAIRACMAPVTAVCMGSVESAGTMIMMACDYMTIHPYTAFMFHAPYTELVGDSSAIRNRLEFDSEYYQNLFLDIYEGFMDESEILDILETTGEVWMTHEEVEDRLDNRDRYFMDRDGDIGKDTVKNLLDSIFKKPS